MDNIYSFAVENPGLSLFWFGLLSFFVLTVLGLAYKARNDRRWANEVHRINERMDEMEKRTERRRPLNARMEWDHKDGLRVVSSDRDGEQFRRDLNEALSRR